MRTTIETCSYDYDNPGFMGNYVFKMIPDNILIAIQLQSSAIPEYIKPLHIQHEDCLLYPCEITMNHSNGEMCELSQRQKY